MIKHPFIKIGFVGDLMNLISCLKSFGKTRITGFSNFEIV
jgi:hypothetical protein